MAMLVRLRLEMADVPGALAHVAGVIADHGGNITALDVQHAQNGIAVDDVTIELPDAGDLQLLRKRLAESGMARVIAIQSPNPEDLLVRVLRRLVGVLGSPPEDRDVALRRGVAELCATPAVWVSTGVDAAAFTAGRQALALRGEAVLMQTEERLPVLADTMTGEAWLLAIAEAGPQHDRVVFVARPLAKPFTTTEISRVLSLMALHTAIETQPQREPAV
jgi:hypothetical protein